MNTSNQELAENKLLLLYIIQKLGISVSNLQITKIILENKFMNYFFLQQYLNELSESHFVTLTEVEGKPYYEITKIGRETLGFFADRIPTDITRQIDNNIQNIKKKIKRETQIVADFIPVSENEYHVLCKVNEDGFTLVDLQLLVGTKADARSICDNWKNNTQQIYQEILNTLIKKRKS